MVKKSETFNHSRGLRQGAPVSPFIFNICLEYLIVLINQACLEKNMDSFLGGEG